MQGYIGEALRQIVEERWEKNSAPVLLSQVPGLLRNRGIDHKVAFGGRNLKAALDEEQIDDVELICDPNDDKIWALVPSSHGLSEERIFANYTKAVQVKKDNGRRIVYKSIVWKAFTEILIDGGIRFFKYSHNNFGYEDVDRFEEAIEGDIEIPRNLIFSDSSQRNFHDVHNAIKSWSDQNGIRYTDLLGENSSLSQYDFWEKIKDLPDSDLSRINIPADIVRKVIS